MNNKLLFVSSLLTNWLLHVEAGRYIKLLSVFFSWFTAAVVPNVAPSNTELAAQGQLNEQTDKQFTDTIHCDTFRLIFTTFNVNHLQD